MGGVDDGEFSIGAYAGVEITSPFAGVFRRGIKIAQVNYFFGFEMVEEAPVEAGLFMRVGVVDEPVAVGKVVEMFRAVKNVRIEGGHIAGSVFEKIESHGGIVLNGFSEDVTGILPDKMGGDSAVIDDGDVFPFGSSRQHSCFSCSIGVAPAVEEDKPGAVGTEQQVVEVMFCVGIGGGNIAKLCDLVDGDNKFFFPGFQIQAVDSCVIRGKVIPVPIRDTDITVTRADVLRSFKVESHSDFTIGAEAVDGVIDGSFYAGINIQDMTDEPTFLAVVPKDFS